MITETIPAAMNDQRIDRVVAFVCGCSRTDAADLVASEAVKVNGRRVRKGSVRVVEGDELQIDESQLPVAPGVEAEPDVAVDVVYEDDDLLVVNKPAGMVVHPGGGTRAGTLVNGLLARYPDIAGVGEAERPGVVHRLDKGTTGLLAIARNVEVLTALQAQLANRSVERRYVCAVVGCPDNDAGEVDAPIGRSPRDATRRAVVAGGKPARTHYRVVSRNSDIDVAWVTCRLETGRTHQIRVHLAAIGHPVLGDGTYGGDHLRMPFARPALHAQTLGFVHPVSEQFLRFEAPLPPDLEALHRKLFAER